MSDTYHLEEKRVQIRADILRIEGIVTCDEHLVTVMRQYLSDAQEQAGYSHEALASAQLALINCGATSTTCASRTATEETPGRQTESELSAMNEALTQVTRPQTSELIVTVPVLIVEETEDVELTVDDIEEFTTADLDDIGTAGDDNFEDIAISTAAEVGSVSGPLIEVPVVETQVESEPETLAVPLVIEEVPTPTPISPPRRRGRRGAGNIQR